jgi:arsenate reductase
MTALIAPASSADLPAAMSLLDACGLPTEGFADHLATALVARDGTSVVASAALELYDDAALLRSVAVARPYRGRGLGERIVRAALDMAARRGVVSVYLLTTTATQFFSRRLGFRPIARADVPDAVRVSAEFTRLCPDGAAAMTCRLASTVTRVVFACVHNAGRSQMAAAFFNALADPAKARAVSAGTRPAGRVHPEVVAVMREVGIDLAGAQPRRLTDELAATARLLVTMGCGEQCPVVPGLGREDWELPDPKEQPVERVRAIRDEIRGRVRGLLDANGWRVA